MGKDNRFFTIPFSLKAGLRLKRTSKRNCYSDLHREMPPCGIESRTSAKRYSQRFEASIFVFMIQPDICGVLSEYVGACARIAFFMFVLLATIMFHKAC